MLLPIHIPSDQSVQPFDENFQNILILVFPKSKSEFFPFALQIAQTAKFYCSSELFKKDHYFAGFELEPNQIKSALALLKYIGSWKGVYVLVNGFEKSAYSAYETLTCIMDSLLVKEPKKYCCSISNSFIKGGDAYWIHPCRIVLTQQQYYKVIPSVDLSIKDQIFAKAIKCGCEWCPNLNLNNLKPLENDLVLKDVT